MNFVFRRKKTNDYLSTTVNFVFGCKKSKKKKKKKESKKQKKTNGCLGTKIEHNENSLVAIKIRKC